MGDQDAAVAWSTAGVQESTLACVRSHVPVGSRVLELGAGSGRLSRMLQSAGYRVTAGDWNNQAFVPSDIACHKVDCDDVAGLLKQFGGTPFDAVVCGDLIEHLKHPWQFVEAIGRLVRPGGHAFITTPNIFSPRSRVNMLVNGLPDSFGLRALEMGHINPIFPRTLRLALSQSGFDVLAETGAGQTRLLPQPSIKGVCQVVLAALLRPLMRHPCSQPVLLVAGRKRTDGTGRNEPLGTGANGFYGGQDGAVGRVPAAGAEG